MHTWPLFHEMQILDVLRLTAGVRGVDSGAVGGCKHCSAHWNLEWSTSLHREQNAAPWPGVMPSIVDA